MVYIKDSIQLNIHEQWLFRAKNWTEQNKYGACLWPWALNLRQLIHIDTRVSQ